MGRNTSGESVPPIISRADHQGDRKGRPYNTHPEAARSCIVGATLAVAPNPRLLLTPGEC